MKKKKKRTLIMSILLIIIIAAVFFISRRNGSNNDVSIEYTVLEKGDIESLVSCTGTLEAIGTVEVSTQLSGTVDQVMVNFNDHVKKGQVLAVLDTLKLTLDLRDAEANLLKTESQYELSRDKYENNLELFKQNFISEIDLKTSETEYLQNYASYLTAENRLESAKLDLREYAVIKSPITGMVIDRSIESGQTVAASLSAPELFLIAEDLSQMEIHALVDECDIGVIEEGQNVRFTVEAYVDDEFEGVVKEIRLQPEIVSNVVNYTVIINADNNEGMLLPGMTATIDIIVESAINVYCLDNSALSVMPNMEMINDHRSARTENQDTERIKERSVNSENQDSQRPTLIWFRNNEGTFGAVRVETGLSNGLITEIKDPGVLVDAEFIVSSVETDGGDETQNNRMMRPGPRMF